MCVEGERGQMYEVQLIFFISLHLMQKAERACLHFAILEPYFPRKNKFMAGEGKARCEEKKKTGL